MKFMNNLTIANIRYNGQRDDIAYPKQILLDLHLNIRLFSELDMVNLFLNFSPIPFPSKILQIFFFSFFNIILTNL